MKLKINSLKQALAISFGLLTCSVAVAEQTSKVITAENLVTLQSVSQAQVSPSGEYIAYTRSVPREIYVEKDGKNWGELYLVNDKGVERPFITGKINVRNIQWSADGSLIYFLAKMNDDKFTNLYQIPANGGQAQKAVVLKDTSINSYALSSDNKQIAILAKKAKDKSVKKLQGLGFKAEVFEEQLTNQLLYVTNLAQSDKAIIPTAWDIKGYVSDVHFSPTGKDLLVKTQPTALIDDKYMKSQWHIVDIANKSVKTSFATEGKLGAAEFSYDGKYVALHGAQDKHDPATGRLFIANVNTGKVANWLPDFNGHVSDFEWSNKRNELYFIANIGTQSVVAKIKPGSNKYKTVVAGGKFIAGNLSISDSDKTVVVKANTAQHPNEVFMLRGKKQTRLTDSNTWLNDVALAKQESLTI